MHKKATILTAIVLTFLLAVGGIYIVSAQTEEEENSDSVPFFGRLRRGFGGPMFGTLDEELREEMQETIQAMRDEGASSEEIREYIKDFLEENGVETQMPELTEEQLEKLQQLREDVQAYAQKRAAELGLELPEKGFFGGRGMRFRGFMRGCRFKGQQEN